MTKNRTLRNAIIAFLLVLAAAWILISFSSCEKDEVNEAIIEHFRCDSVPVYLPCVNYINWKTEDDRDTCIGIPVDCDDGLICTEDWCDTISEHCLYDTIPNCVCDSALTDGDLCTADSCGVFTPINCDDNDGCTNDYCVNGVCLNTAVGCDDGDPCTLDDCDRSSGACQWIDTCTTPCYFDTIPKYAWSGCKVTVCVNGNTYNAVRSCDDGVPCTNDICMEGPNDGSHTCLNLDIICDDGSGIGGWWCCEDGNCHYDRGPADANGRCL